MADNDPATRPADPELSLDEALFNRLAEMDDARAALSREVAELRAELTARTERFHIYVEDQARVMDYLCASARSCVAKL